jgi:predicted 3-demethylubiquinone-9 3-methyltransferase (glyoxalase superfamily)
MDEYWSAISESHKMKVQKLADHYGVSVEKAFRNLLRQLEQDMTEQGKPGHSVGILTARQVEQMLDDIGE